MCIRDRTDAADAWHDDQRIERVLGQENVLEAAIERGTDLSRSDPTVGDVERPFEVAFDAIEGTDGQTTSHLRPLFLIPGEISG